MKDHDARFKLNLAAEHDFACIVCGYYLAHAACITVEHVVPRSKGGSGRANKAPSHFNCNKLKGVLSLAEAKLLVREKLVSLGPDWRRWLNKPVPNRIVPAEALWDPIDAGWHFFTRWHMNAPRQRCKNKKKQRAA